jgi:hypothetical protein
MFEILESLNSVVYFVIPSNIFELPSIWIVSLNDLKLPFVKNSPFNFLAIIPSSLFKFLTSIL